MIFVFAGLGLGHVEVAVGSLEFQKIVKSFFKRFALHSFLSWFSWNRCGTPTRCWNLVHSIFISLFLLAASTIGDLGVIVPLRSNT